MSALGQAPEGTVKAMGNWAAADAPTQPDSAHTPRLRHSTAQERSGDATSSGG